MLYINPRRYSDLTLHRPPRVCNGDGFTLTITVMTAVTVIPSALLKVLRDITYADPLSCAFVRDMTDNLGVVDVIVVTIILAVCSGTLGRLSQWDRVLSIELSVRVIASGIYEVVILLLACGQWTIFRSYPRK